MKSIKKNIHQEPYYLVFQDQLEYVNKLLAKKKDNGGFAPFELIITKEKSKKLITPQK